MKEANDALLTLGQRIRSVNPGEIAANDKMTITVDEMLDRFLAMKQKETEPTTHDWYKRYLAGHVRPVIGRMKLRDLTDAHVESLIDGARDISRTKQRGKPLSGQTKRNLLVGISAALRWAAMKKLVAENVAANIKPAKLAHVERVDVDLPEVKLLFAAVAGTELESVVAFQIGSGLRRGETCGLLWTDVDLVAGTVKVQRAAANLRGKVFIKSPKNEGSKRTEFLAPFVIPVLEKHRDAQAARHRELGIRDGGDGYVFDRAAGQRVKLIDPAKPNAPQAYAHMWDPNELSRLFTRMRQRNKLPAIRLHDCRHGFATMSFAAGIDPLTVSRSLGHSSLATTNKIYIHQLDKTKRAAASKYGAYISSAVTPKTEPGA